MSSEKVILNKPAHPCMNSCCNILAQELFPLSVETSINREIILLQATHPISEPIWPLKMLSSSILKGPFSIYVLFFGGGGAGRSWINSKI